MTLDIGDHASIRFDEIKKNGTARPIEFPAPIIKSGSRTVGLAYEPKSGKYYKIKNVLVQQDSTMNRHRDGISIRGIPTITSHPTYHSNGISNSDTPMNEIGYYLKRKLSKSTFGYIYKAVMMKKRKILPPEISILRKLRRGNSSDKSFVGRCCEEDDWDEASKDDNQHEAMDTNEYIWQSTGDIVIVKASSWSKIIQMRGKHLEDPLKEIQAMQLLGNNNPYVTYNIEALQDDLCLYCIMPYYKNGDLYGVVMNGINDHQRLQESSCHKYFKQLLGALHHLQQKGMSHRDLSLENVLLHDHKCKIIDFGMALRVPHASFVNAGAVTDISEGSSRLLIYNQGQGGKLAYMAPELVAQESFDGFAIDLWAAGIILYILLIGHKPFHWAHKSDLMYVRLSQNGMLRESLKYWNIELSDEACDLLQSMLWENENRRITLAEAINHPWMVNGRCKKSTQ